MLVLQTLAGGPLHGYGVAKSIRTRSRDGLDIEFGSLYPALKRLEVKRWISSQWEISETNRRAKYYRLTPAGRRQLEREHGEWQAFAESVARVMRTAEDQP